jgi:hypothetical protein
MFCEQWRQPIYISMASSVQCQTSSPISRCLFKKLITLAPVHTPDVPLGNPATAYTPSEGEKQADDQLGGPPQTPTFYGLRTTPDLREPPTPGKLDNVTVSEVHFLMHGGHRSIKREQKRLNSLLPGFCNLAIRNLYFWSPKWLEINPAVAYFIAKH